MAHAKPPCDLLILPGVTPANKGLAPSGNSFILLKKIFIFTIQGAHIGLAKKRVQWLVEHSTSHQLLWYIDSFELRNPLLRKAAKRYAQCYDDRATDEHYSLT